MAPTQQRARKQGVAKPVTRKPRPAPRQTSQSREVAQRQRSGSRDSDIENEDPTIDEEQPLAIEQASQANDSILALQEMADRLGREVETFAESLDKFLDELRPDEPYDLAHDLVLDFKRQALDKVGELNAKYEKERREELRREWAEQAKVSTTGAKSVLSSSLQARSITSSNVKALRRYQEEADTWELFRIVLEQHYRPNIDATRLEKEKQEKLGRLSAVNKYTHDDALFDRFLLEDNLGQERALVKTWLEQIASHQQSDMDGITQELEKQGDIGRGIWSRGWLNTREKIKNEKRLRTWPAPDSSPLPQVRSVETNELLVTSLDPDAASRQGRSIEPQDAFHERAMWTTCWEMLRRGMPWDEVANWFEQQNEGWRAVVTGKAMSGASAATTAAWRRMCFLASQKECSNEYEAAVYGLLGGNMLAIKPVCRSVDDQLFARYSVNLIRQFDQWLLATHPEHLPPALRGHEDTDVRDTAVAQHEILNLIRQLRKRSDTRAQTVSPLKLVQSYLLANETEALIHTMGVAISDDDAAEDLALARSRGAEDHALTKPEAEAARDPICLRVVAHICIILQVLRKEQLVVEDQEMEDNVLVNYIQALHMAGKRDMIPVYASRLQKARYVASLTTVLPSMIDSKERQDMVALMLHYGMDVVAVTQSVFKSTLDRTIAAAEPASFSILKDSHDGLYPGKRIDVEKVPDLVTAEQDALVRALEWYLLLPKQWDETFGAFTTAMRAMLVSGNFACARLICENFKSQKIAEVKGYQVLGHTFNLWNDEVAGPPAEQEPWILRMKERAKTYIELERLIEAFEALITWTKQEAVYMKNRAAMASLPQDIRQAFFVVSDAMEFLLSTDGFLLDSFTEEEAVDFASIRRTYVTEAIVGYISVLCSAGTLITRDMLLTALDVSTAIADERTGLTETFTEAKRMKEVVTMFAQISKRILLMKGLGKAWKPKHEKSDGRNPNIWDIPSERTISAMTS